MTDLADPTTIEEVVGVPRHWRAHWGRVVSKEETVYILHSKNCLEDNPDLRDCEFSLALDNGININDWILDTPVVLDIRDNRLVPAVIGLTEPPK